MVRNDNFPFDDFTSCDHHRQATAFDGSRIPGSGREKHILADSPLLPTLREPPTDKPLITRTSEGT
eukprot:CAMPEP_0204321388 /NCGR_PEP_ID=MMETSP0469-20131031/8128_1 /ASSEMBLY_ACC=CAM_ASM_000384 /TAXON_ID=2969 /ORGANISM="Oxyrrhis marina" /LENGTH=65 /DNA_ID=CAMNT_0051302671 /DNA_START=33 /DNA_END=230 /DNA_ORIENTATION=-